MPGRSERARIFPATGWAALRAREAVTYAAWSALGTLDGNGSGHVKRDDAAALLADWRGLHPRSVRRILSDGEDRRSGRLAGRATVKSGCSLPASRPCSCDSSWTASGLRG